MGAVRKTREAIDDMYTPTSNVYGGVWEEGIPKYLTINKDGNMPKSPKLHKYPEHSFNRFHPHDIKCPQKPCSHKYRKVCDMFPTLPARGMEPPKETRGVDKDRFTTSNSVYGQLWFEGDQLKDTFPNAISYKEMLNRKEVLHDQVPKYTKALSGVHNPEHPCGIMGLPNVATNTKGQFTNVRRDFNSDQYGVWSNGCFNTEGARLCNNSKGTYSNLQGAWSRIGPSTYDATHGHGPWVNNWETVAYQPATLRSLRDHKNVDPRDNYVPIEDVPQNMWNRKP